MTIKTKPQTHTPGPWRFRRGQHAYKNWNPYEVYGHDGTTMVAFCNSSVSLNEPNARLIAAAPELLEAAKMARVVLGELRGGPHEEPVVLRVLCDAITKAEGQEVQ